MSNHQTQIIMKRIEFIAPVSALRGNLSGAQTLTYPTKNNSAWDAPSDKKSFATNYKPRYVGAKRSRDGFTFFAIKERSAINQSEQMRKIQALLGATTSLTASMLKYPNIIQNVTVAWQRAWELKLTTLTLNRWAQDIVRQSLNDGIDFYFNLNAGVFIVQNPFAENHAQGSVPFTPNKELLAKFWLQLSNPSGFYFYVNGATGIAFQSQTFGDIISNNRLNVLNLSIDPNPSPGYGDVMQGAMYVCDKNDDGTFAGVSQGESVVIGRRYILTPDPHENGG